MHPKKKRGAGPTAKPNQSMIDDVMGPSLFTRVAIFPIPAAMEPGVISVKAAVEAGCRRALGIEHLRSNEGGCAITVLTQEVRKIGQISHQGCSQIAQVIELWVRASQNRR